jgi:hypothetical protein
MIGGGPGGQGRSGGFRRDLGGAKAFESKGRGAKPVPGADSRAARGEKM